MNNFSDHGAPRTKEDGAPVPAADAAPPNGAREGAAEGESAMEALLRESDYAFRRLRRGETVEGTIVRVDPDEVLVDIGSKSEGVIPARELANDSEPEPELQVGDRTLVYVMQPEGHEGHAVLSLRRAQTERSWREIDELYRQGGIVEGPVVDFNRGGLIVDVKGVRGFVPVSQVLELRNVVRHEGENEEISQALAAMRGKRLPLKVIEINRSRNRLILSERAAAQEQRSQRKDELLEQLEAGQIRRGVVSNITNFGAFVDLGGADGLVHVSELSYNRVNHPTEVLNAGQEVDVYVLSVDREGRKIALSVKRALPDPWETIEQRYHLGQIVPGVITKLVKFGVFAKVEEGLEGLIHLSELTDIEVQDASRVVHEGQEIKAKIISINSERRRLGLSVRQAAEPVMPVESYGEVEENTPLADGLAEFEYEEAAEDAEAPQAEAEVVELTEAPAAEVGQPTEVEESPETVQPAAEAQQTAQAESEVTAEAQAPGETQEASIQMDAGEPTAEAGGNEVASEGEPSEAGDNPEHETNGQETDRAVAFDQISQNESPSANGATSDASEAVQAVSE
ncbi:MAG: 30S ribosomal protein S1 [Chloroflexota bacterium]